MGFLNDLVDGVFGGGPDTPQPPDYLAAAKQTGDSSIQTAILNAMIGRVNQSGPYGSQTWNQNGMIHIPGVGGAPGFDIPNFSSSTNLSPEGKQLFDADTNSKLGLANLEQGMLPGVADSMSAPLDFSGLPGDYNTGVADAMYSRATRYLDPQWDEGQRNLDTKLANSGFSRQNEGYGAEQNKFQLQRDAAYGGARDTAIAGGISNGMLARNQAISEMLTKRTQPLSEFNSLRTGAQPGMPAFASQPQGTATPTNYLQGAQLAGQSQNDIFNSQMGSHNANTQMVGTIAGAAAIALF